MQDSCFRLLVTFLCALWPKLKETSKHKKSLADHIESAQSSHLVGIAKQTSEMALVYHSFHQQVGRKHKFQVSRM